MSLRTRLPTISPSAVPAPKYAARQQQYGPRRPSFWKSESDRYWEKCRHKKQSARRKTVGLAIVVLLGFVVAVTLLLMAGQRGGTGVSAEEAEDFTTIPTTPEGVASINENGVSDGLRLQTQACVGSAQKHGLESKTCANVCAKARTTAPRPLAHRSCLAGCRAGITTAWDTACTGGRHRDCVRASAERCEFNCASYRNQFPKPTIFNQCLRSCLDVVDNACLKSKEVFVSVEMFSGEGSGGPATMG